VPTDRRAETCLSNSGVWGMIIRFRWPTRGPALAAVLALVLSAVWIAPPRHAPHSAPLMQLVADGSDTITAPGGLADSRAGVLAAPAPDQAGYDSEFWKVAEGGGGELARFDGSPVSAADLPVGATLDGATLSYHFAADAGQWVTDHMDAWNTPDPAAPTVPDQPGSTQRCIGLPADIESAPSTSEEAYCVDASPFQSANLTPPYDTNPGEQHVTLSAPATTMSRKYLPDLASDSVDEAAIAPDSGDELYAALRAEVTCWVGASNTAFPTLYGSWPGIGDLVHLDDRCTGGQGLSYGGPIQSIKLYVDWVAAPHGRCVTSSGYLCLPDGGGNYGNPEGGTTRAAAPGLLADFSSVSPQPAWRQRVVAVCGIPGQLRSTDPDSWELSANTISASGVSAVGAAFPSCPAGKIVEAVHSCMMLSWCALGPWQRVLAPQAVTYLNGSARCYDGTATCTLGLYQWSKSNNGSWSACAQSDVDCSGWVGDPAVAGHYACMFGPYWLPLNNCAVLARSFDPDTLGEHTDWSTYGLGLARGVTPIDEPSGLDWVGPPPPPRCDGTSVAAGDCAYKWVEAYFDGDMNPHFRTCDDGGCSWLGTYPTWTALIPDAFYQYANADGSALPDGNFEEDALCLGATPAAWSGGAQSALGDDSSSIAPGSCGDDLTRLLTGTEPSPTDSPTPSDSPSPTPTDTGNATPALSPDPDETVSPSDSGTPTPTP
jgi:hypothetical protein